MELLSNTLLHNGKYKIIEKIGQGGFGIAYKAIQVNRVKLVCIKEFFYIDLCDRMDNSQNMKVISNSPEKTKVVDSLKKKFIKEAKRLARFNHPNIVKVIEVFEENDTAYYVMEYLDGGSVEELISRDGPICEDKAKELILPIVDALETVHKKGLLHLDIKPANVMLRNERTPVLIDFGISKYIDDGNNNNNTKTTAPIGYSDSYSPIEQSSFGSSVSDFTKSTDIYSVCATIYKMVTGVIPPKPNQIITNGLLSPRELVPNLTVNFSDAVVKGMSIKIVDRQQTCSQLRNDIGQLSNVSQATILNVTEIVEQKLATADDYVKRATLKQESGQLNEAIEDFTEAMKLEGNCKELYYFRAICYYENEDYKKAIKDFSEVVVLDSKEYHAYYFRGNCFYELNEFDEAIKDYTTLIDSGSNDSASYYSAAYFKRGLCYDLLHQHSEAANDFYSAYDIKQDSEFFDEWINSIKITKDITFLDKYLANYSYNNKDVYFLRGKIHYELGNLNNAIEDLKNAKINGCYSSEQILNKISWKSPSILIPHIMLGISNIIAVVSTIYVIFNEISIVDYEKWHWTLIPMIISIIYSFKASYPHWQVSTEIHSLTEHSFQVYEKLAYSFIYILLYFLISFCLYFIWNSSDDFLNDVDNPIFIVVTYILISAFYIHPTYGLYLVWSNSEKRNTQSDDIW